MTIIFKKIQAIPSYPTGTSAILLSGKKWNSGSVSVSKFRIGIKAALRTAQLAQCCFCRRQLGDDIATHIEHFVDKSSFPSYTFEIRNLALCCGTCNVSKNGYVRSFESRLQKRRLKYGSTQEQVFPTLSSPVLQGAPFPSIPADFRWVNPYVHDFSAHIKIARGWVYEKATLVGYRTIRGVRLNQIAAIEARALKERRAVRSSGVLSTLAASLSDLSDDDLQKAAEELAAELRSRREALS